MLQQPMPRTIAARLGYVALYGAVGASFPYLPVYYGSRDLDLETIGLLTALAAGAGLVAAPVWGVVADRFAGSRLILPTAALLAAAGAAVLALMREPLLIGLAVAFTALGFSGIGPMLDARAIETVNGDQDRYGGLRAWGSASFIAVVWLTGALIERAGPASLFAVYVAALLACAIVTVPLRGERGTASLPRLSGIGVVLRHPPLARFLLAALLVLSAAMVINWYLSIHLINLGAPGALVGAAWAIGALVEIPVMASYPWLASRVGSERLLVIGASALALRALAVLVVSDPVLVALSMALHGLGFALVLVGGVTYVARNAPPATAATAQGILSATAYSLALMIGPGVGSLTAGIAGVPAMFVLGLASSVAGIPVLWLAVGNRATAAGVASEA